MFTYVAYNNVFHNLAKDASQWYESVVRRVWFKVFLWIGVTSAWSQSLGSLLVLYDCWKMCVMMGAICSAVPLRTLAGSSSGPVALFWLRFFNCLIILFAPISRGGMLEYNEGFITGMGYLSLVKTDVNWLLRAFALSRSFVIVYHLLSGWECQCFLVYLPWWMTRIVLDLSLDFLQFGCLHKICRKLPML